MSLLIDFFPYHGLYFPPFFYSQINFICFLLLTSFHLAFFSATELEIYSFSPGKCNYVFSYKLPSLSLFFRYETYTVLYADCN